MDFRRSPASADADRLIFLPPFPPLAQRCAFTTVLSMKYKPTRDLTATWSKICFQIPPTRRESRSSLIIS
jgi:hypothetical protein